MLSCITMLVNGVRLYTPMHKCLNAHLQQRAYLLLSARGYTHAPCSHQLNCSADQACPGQVVKFLFVRFT